MTVAIHRSARRNLVSFPGVGKDKTMKRNALPGAKAVFLEHVLDACSLRSVDRLNRRALPDRLFLAIISIMPILLTAIYRIAEDMGYEW